eukprot:COSAG02_NODE_2314_length_9156_cov_8.075072_10_plen_664_part_00
MRVTMRRGGVVRRGVVVRGLVAKPVVLRTSAAPMARREHSAAAAAAQRDLQSLTVPQLKEIVRTDNVSMSGGMRHKRKAELIDAILEHRTKEGTLRAPRGTPSLYTGSGELAPRPALGEPVVAKIPATVQGKLRASTTDVVAALSTLKRGDRPQAASAAPAAPRKGPRVPQLVQPTAAVLEAPGMVSEALAEAPVVLFSKTFCPHCKDVVAMFDKLGLTQKPHIVELDLLQPQRMDAMQDHLKDLTGARSVPRVFVDGNFIGGADDTIAAHASGKLAEVLVEAGALPKPVPKHVPAPAPPASPPAAPPAAPQPTSALLEDLAALPTRPNRTILAAPSSRTMPRGPRPTPTMHTGAGQLAPVHDTSIIAAPTGPRYSPVSTRSKLDVVQQLKEATSARSRVAVAPKTPAEVEVAKMESSVKAEPKADPKAEPKAAPLSKQVPTKTTPEANSSVGGGSGGTEAGGTGSSVGSALGGFALPGGLSLDKLSVPHMVGAGAAAWALGLISIYLNKPKTDDIPPSAPNTESISQAIKNVSAAELGAAGKEEMAAVVRIVQRLDRIENEVANLERPNPRRDALLKAKKLLSDAAGAGNARDPDRMKLLHATAADLRKACAAQGAGTEAAISEKVAELDTAEKIEAAAVGVTLGVASGLLVYGIIGAFGRR